MLTSDGLRLFLLQDHKTERVHGHVLEPCKISVHVDMTKGTGDVRLQISDVHIRVSPDVIELGASLQASVLEPLIQPSADRYDVFCGLIVLSVGHCLLQLTDDLKHVEANAVDLLI